MPSMSCSSGTIVAAATPPGNGGIGIVRISGQDALSLAHKIISKALKPRYAAFVVVSVDKIKDSAVAIYFKSPNSFTGEDVVEIQCHGGTLLIQTIIDKLISFGARMALPGEFTRRALLNGKITLSGAESLINIIHAESGAELAAASDISAGELHEKLYEIEKKLIELSAQIDGALDHPEEIAVPDIKPQLNTFIKTLTQFTDNAKASDYIYNGIRVAIIGKPNVGKSSIFNKILGLSRSIVTEIAGTTTDTVSETLQIGGYKIRFMDTAGIRESGNKIEKLGIERTIAAARECDIAIIVSSDTDDTEIINLVKDKPYIIANNNCDIEALKRSIIEKTTLALPKSQSRIIANARQLSELESALSALKNITVASSPDLIASDIQTALYHIGNITGTNTAESVLDEIFSRFCLGK